MQNAWQTEYPQEMIEYIQLMIPRGADVDNPIEDAALMARIGAKKICDIATFFELKNAATGTRFTFYWSEIYGAKEGSADSICTVRREEMIVWKLH